MQAPHTSKQTFSSFIAQGSLYTPKTGFIKGLKVNSSQKGAPGGAPIGSRVQRVRQEGPSYATGFRGGNQEGPLRQQSLKEAPEGAPNAAGFKGGPRGAPLCNRVQTGASGGAPLGSSVYWGPQEGPPINKRVQKGVLKGP